MYKKSEKNHFIRKEVITLLEHASSSGGFLGMALIAFLFVSLSLLRAWCFTDAIRKLFSQQRD